MLICTSRRMVGVKCSTFTPVFRHANRQATAAAAAATTTRLTRLRKLRQRPHAHMPMTAHSNHMMTNHFFHSRVQGLNTRTARYPANSSARYFSSAKSCSAPFRVLFFGSDMLAIRCLDRLVARPDIAKMIEVVCPSDHKSKQRGKQTVQRGML
jgi:hypothetical protein